MLRIMLVSLLAVSTTTARPHAATAWVAPKSTSSCASAAVTMEVDGMSTALAIRGGAEVLKMEERSLVGTFIFMLKAFFAVGSPCHTFLCHRHSRSSARHHRRSPLAARRSPLAARRSRSPPPPLLTTRGCDWRTITHHRASSHS